MGAGAAAAAGSPAAGRVWRAARNEASAESGGAPIRPPASRAPCSRCVPRLALPPGAAAPSQKSRAAEPRGRGQKLIVSAGFPRATGTVLSLFELVPMYRTSKFLDLLISTPSPLNFRGFFFLCFPRSL